MQNPAKVAFAIADLGQLNQGNILGMTNDASLAADNVLNAAPAPTQKFEV